MLAQAIRNNLNDIDKLKMQSKSIPYNKTIKEVADSYFNVEDKTEIVDEEIEIVENPEETVVEFPIVLGIELEEKLPFFKSITYKLAQVF